MELVRSFTVLGTDHRVQRCAKRTDSIKDPDYKQLLGQLLLHSNIDFIFEEAQALGPTLAEQIALEVLGPDRYEDVDPPKSAWGSLGIQETCKGFFIGELDFENQVWPYALEQTVLAHEKREQVWLAAILNRPSFESALMVCGCHYLLRLSLAAKELSGEGFLVHAYHLRWLHPKAEGSKNPFARASVSPMF